MRGEHTVTQVASQELQQKRQSGGWIGLGQTKKAVIQNETVICKAWQDWPDVPAFMLDLCLQCRKTRMCSGCSSPQTSRLTRSKTSDIQVFESFLVHGVHTGRSLSEISAGTYSWEGCNMSKQCKSCLRLLFFFFSQCYSDKWKVI